MLCWHQSSTFVFEITSFHLIPCINLLDHLIARQLTANLKTVPTALHFLLSCAKTAKASSVAFSLSRDCSQPVTLYFLLLRKFAEVKSAISDTIPKHFAPWAFAWKSWPSIGCAYCGCECPLNLSELLVWPWAVKEGHDWRPYAVISGQLMKYGKSYFTFLVLEWLMQRVLNSHRQVHILFKS